MRLDILISQNQNISRNKACDLIKNGNVWVDGKVCIKPSFIVSENQVEIKNCKNYVSRGAYKLLGAIENFNLKFDNKIVLDIGASTGGFTQVALENGAKKVYSVDVGSGQLDKSFAVDKRVVNLENTDFRNLDFNLVKDTNMIIGDISFISLSHILPYIIKLFGKNIECLLLFKPQFECGKDIAKKYKGIIKDKKIHIFLLKRFVEYCKNLDFNVSDIIQSSIKGKDGNIEYLIYFNNYKFVKNIEEIVENAFSN